MHTTNNLVTKDANFAKVFLAVCFSVGTLAYTAAFVFLYHYFGKFANSSNDALWFCGTAAIAFFVWFMVKFMFAFYHSKLQDKHGIIAAMVSSLVFFGANILVFHLHWQLSLFTTPYAFGIGMIIGGLNKKNWWLYGPGTAVLSGMAVVCAVFFGETVKLITYPIFPAMLAFAVIVFVIICCVITNFFHHALYDVNSTVSITNFKIDWYLLCCIVAVWIIGITSMISSLFENGGIATIGAILVIFLAIIGPIQMFESKNPTARVIYLTAVALTLPFLFIKRLRSSPT